MKNLFQIFLLLTFLFPNPNFIFGQTLSMDRLDTIATSCLATSMQLENHYRILSVHDHTNTMSFANDKFFQFEAKDSKFVTFCKLSNVDTSGQKIQVTWLVSNDSVLAHVELKSDKFFGFWQFVYKEQSWSLVSKKVDGTIKNDDKIFSVLTSLELVRIYDEWLLKLAKHAKFETENSEEISTGTLTFETRTITENSQHQFKIIYQKSVIKEGSTTTIVYLNAIKNRTTDKAFHITKYYLFLVDQQSILEAKYAEVEDATKAKPIPLVLLLEILLNPSLPN